MGSRFGGRKLACSVLAFFAMFFLYGLQAYAQSSGTGALTGTVTDATGKSVPNATVTITSTATGQARTTVTGAAGNYNFLLLPPGTYNVRFSAPGFKNADVTGIVLTVTNTPTLDHVMEVGAVTETVTVEGSVETLQTESSTLGTTVSSRTIEALPMANGNYTEILSLSAGANVGVDNATALGKGTQDMSVNGVDPGSNNFQMDGVAVNNIANSGSANDGTIYGGIPIPSPDAIAEFKVQTSTYDASYGRNPGANVNVVTKSGTNNFHGSGFEYLRNSELNSSDYFYNLTPGQGHEVLNQNQFGGTIGGPIKKDKVFFFFSYRGTRSKNAVAPQGQTFGAILGGIPAGLPSTSVRGTCPAPPAGAPESAPDLPISACDANAQAFATAMGINNIVGLRIMQLTTGTKTFSGVTPNYYIPSPASDPQFCNAGTGVCNFSVPAIYNENQYVANGDWVITSKNTLSLKYFYTANPQTLYLGQGGGNLPGSPQTTPWGNQNAVARLTTLVTNNFVNVVRLSYQRNNGSATSLMPPGGSPADLGMQPLVPGFYEPPTMINVLDNYTLFGGLLPFTGPTNQIQAADEISWSHGKHSVRAGYEYEWTNWPLTDAGLQQGLILLFGLGGFQNGVNSPASFWNVGCLFCVKGITGENGITHFYHVNNQNTYVLDDWKVTPRLTINVGLRWEYDGLLSDSLGRLTQVWLDRMAPNSVIPTSFSSTNPIGIQQYVVPGNFAAHFGSPPPGVATAANNNTIQGHAPYSDFAPRLGFAWQAKDKLVIRGGAGIFYDREGLDRIVHAFEQGYPYAATYDFGAFSPRWFQSTLAQPYPAIGLVCMPSDPNCNTNFGLGFAPRFADTTTANSPAQVNSGLSTPYDPNSVHTPLVQEYSLGFQYEFLPHWVLEAGYVGSSGIHLTDYNHNHNQALLATPTDDPNGVCTGVAPNIICNTGTNAAFRVPYLGYEADGLQASDNDAFSKFNSLQVTVRHQFSRGLTLQAAYTWGKNLSAVFNSNSANINDSLDLRAQYGPVSYNRSQRFVINYSYDFPFGRGMQGFEGKLIYGWNVSGVTIAQTGDPLTFIDPGAPGIPAAGSAYGTANTGVLSGVTTAQFCPGFGNGNVKNPGSTKANLNHYWNPDAFNFVTCVPAPVPFGDATALGYGNSGVGIVTGPGQFNWDISIQKNTQLTEGLRMQFRTDFYNAFNHSQFADPGASSFGAIGFENITAPTFGVINHVNVNPRLIQFGIRLMF
jgi:Carboxypeptidase regulatory-like domain/TonB-dependent Receptor Plug Domain